MTILSFPVPLYFFAPTTETPPILTKSTVLLSEFGTRGAGRAKPFVGRWYGGTGVAVWGEVLSGADDDGGYLILPLVPVLQFLYKSPVVYSLRLGFVPFNGVEAYAGYCGVDGGFHYED
eukprot:CAMPEP_0118651794 /NCGR_PEP_ID=MMETSP0785-20121206/10972_1 /TAXON_ID=91992 /ORGANISM="Bolidomonas pacifica, Strain CCMP 1866" /LENGTH=118 /DNA_ID=CAMNT_0006544263 /DNA_START=693 /DNA_END=1050 /DNA_ORIENTATION=+